MGFFRLSGITSKKSSDGFPWISAFVVYLVSWSWSLIRPNSLYWDDWIYIFNQPQDYLGKIFSKTGLPPWRAVIDRELLGYGYWTIRWMTFIMFFVCGMLLYEILKKTPFISLVQSRHIVLLFLALPLNHARVSLVMFGYTTSYFLFFLAWMLLVKFSGWVSYISACLCLMASLMTHSFLFFCVLPILQFVYLYRDQLLLKKPNIKTVFRLTVLLLVPIIYYILRSVKWPPDDEYKWYHTIYLRAFFVGTTYLAPFLISAILAIVWMCRGKRVTPNLLVMMSGLLTFGLGVFPYIISGNLDSHSVFFFWELGWTSRHQLLMPLGVSLLIVGLVHLVSANNARRIFAFVLSVSVVLNVYWGVGTYVDSKKKEQLEHLLSAEIVQDKSQNYVFVDETTRFNFREDVYRRYEFAGILSKAGKAVSSVEDRCGGEFDQTEVTIRSNKSLLQAFFSRDVGLALEVRPCKSS